METTRIWIEVPGGIDQGQARDLFARLKGWLVDNGVPVSAYGVEQVYHIEEGSI